MNRLYKQYVWIFDIVAILVISFFLAKITGVFIAKKLEVERSVAILKRAVSAEDESQYRNEDYYKIIVERNIFDSSDVPVIEPTEEEQQEEMMSSGELVETTLGIKVIGVLVVGDGKDGRSSATIVAPGGNNKAKVYAVGEDESFSPGVKLMLIQPDRIEFLNSGRREFAKVETKYGESIFGPPKGATVVASKGAPEKPAAAGVVEEGSGRFVIDQAEIENAMQNLDKLYTEIRAVPHFSGGKVSGMKVLSVKSGSVFAKLGLQRGDILKKINGMELDVRKGFEIFSRLKDSKNLTLDYERGGKNVTNEYEIR
ncbi:MAG: type II secretion system protein GspC [Pseudomonadota bacterium]